MSRVNFEKIEKNTAKKLVELKAAAAATKDANLAANLAAVDSIAATVGEDAAQAARSAVLAGWTAANPEAVTVTADEVAAIKAAVTAISTAAPVAASHSQLLRSDLDSVKAMGITPLRLVHGLLSDFLALPADEQESKLDKWREFALVNRDYSADNVLLVAGLLPTEDESPDKQDEAPSKGTKGKK